MQRNRWILKISFTLMLMTSVELLALPCPAGEAPIASYAVVVGSNRPGKGQAALQFAKEDADRFGEVLKELGGYLPGRIKTLYDPDGRALKDALQAAASNIGVHTAADEKSVFLFYYSGHARASALNLGPEEMPLSELRGLLDAVPSTLKIVVLDACQTGAISNVKGAAPAADFSFNSVNDLKSRGMVIIASSAATEPAQESPRLRGSFFTHHLTAALRGAGDADGNGRVTLDEAYRYTYNRTLVDTAETAVGKQHVSLETDLTGEGETVLSWPSGARARLSLQGGIDGEFLVFRKDDKTVMAEVHKAGADALTLALPPGKYEILIRQTDKAYTCDLSLGEGAEASLNPHLCKKTSVKSYDTKGLMEKRREHVFFELGIGTLFKTDDRYVSRLNDFNFVTTELLDNTVLHYNITIAAGILRYLQAGLTFYKLDSGSFRDDATLRTFEWRAHAAGAFIRARFPVAKDWVVPYVQAGGGVAWGRTRFAADTESKGDGAVDDEERFIKYQVGGGGGLQLMPWRFVGFLVQVDYTFAPVIDNLIGDVHNSGGVSVFSGVRGGF